MPITQRFGADGALLDLAVKAGKNRAFNTRFQQGQQALRNAQNNQAQLRALELESQRLKIMAEQSRRSFGTPITGRDRVRRNPLTRSTQQSLAEFKQPDQQPVSLGETGGTPGSGSISGGDTKFKIDDKGNISGTQGDQQLTPEQIRERGGFVQGQAPAPPRSANSQIKQRFLDNVGDLDPASKQALQALVDSEDITPGKFTTEVNKLRQETNQDQISARQTQSSQISLNRQKVGDVEEELGRVEARLQGTDPPVNVVGRTNTEVAEMRTQAQRDQNLDLAVQLRRVLELREEKRKLRVSEQSLIAEQVTAPNPTAPVQSQPAPLAAQDADQQARQRIADNRALLGLPPLQ